MPLDTGLSITPGRVVGQPIDRRDGRLKVTGRARYAAEFDIDNLAHAVLVQSTIASGEVIGFNLADAQAVPGVLTIMTPDNAPRLPQAGSGQSETAGPLVAKPLLQDRLVYYNGGGGANLEYFSYDDTGNKIPINDTNNAAAIKAFYNISAGPQLKFASVTVSGGQVHLNVTVPTGTATLEQASVLTGSPSDWSTAQSGVTGTTTIDLPAATSGNKFYRLKQ